MASSLLNLEEDLTCSICLCPFDSPVSLTCGHSFCQQCLEEAWRNDVSVSCPHCRTLYPQRPELKRNTVLSAVVETLKFSGNLSSELETKPKPQPEPRAVPEPVLCDTCMHASAESTCMTCAASFCAEHVRPHRENPVYRAHRLVEPPLADLQRRLCEDHVKLLEFYCEQHERPICSSCIQEQHRGCGFSTTKEQRVKKESEFKEKLGTLDGKVEKNQLVISQMREQQAKLKDMAAVRKRALETEYQQLRDLLQRDEKEAMMTLDKDLESGQSKLTSLMKKFQQNIEKMGSTREEITRLLAQSESLDFLQASVDMPSVVAFEPYTPRINVDSKRVIAHHASVVHMKELISKILQQPVENRILGSNPGAGEASSLLPNPRQTGSVSSEEPRSRSPPQMKGAGAKKKAQPREKSENRFEAKDKGEKKEKRDNKEGKQRQRKANKGMTSQFSKSVENELNFSGLVTGFASLGVCAVDRSHLLRPSLGVCAVDRNHLLRHATILVFDQKTAHRRVLISENGTRATVSDESVAYQDNPARFSVCSQVLCSKGFSQGCHYWEVQMSSNNFCGVGLAYGSMDRKGPSSRLGRNAQSWCVEWFNIKLSAWHNNSETILNNPHPERVGVLLNLMGGAATFYNIRGNMAYPFHSFVIPMSEAVFPAFWIFSSGSSVSLCKLTK
ncbi:E3 ubiquitin/ISG15 ligase TRIM25 isoform X2 [Hoplias malabaricus]|uniref:E3 ubiquitin/ISG15 ligase TRIM25 isoform X2 n=1 Tax=Hoplias malabaricus TaxID=27720 RepID=UPI0034632857